MSMPILTDAGYVVRRIRAAEKNIQDALVLYSLGRLDAAEDLLDQANGSLERATVTSRTMIGKYYWPTRDLSYIKSRAAEESLITCSLTADGHLHITMPWLMPRKRHGTTSYLAAPLYKVLEGFAKKHPELIRRPGRQVIMFVTVFGPEINEKRFLDVDNFETNFITDAVALYFLADDGPMRLAQYAHWGLKGKATRTHIILVPEDVFLASAKSVLDELASEEPAPEPDRDRPIATVPVSSAAYARSLMCQDYAPSEMTAATSHARLEGADSYR